jgi:Crinkler effector protein N-terminal domain
MSEYSLWCLIERDKTPFSVDLLPTLSIDQLKRKIKSGRSRMLEKYDAADLILWKVRHF